MHRGVIFVVDDELDEREGLKELLEPEYVVLPARNGTEALARMRGITAPAVAIIDLVLPGMNGWELIAAMKRDPTLSRIPIIVVSGNSREPVAGADRQFEKPYALESLVVAVKQLC